MRLSRRHRILVWLLALLLVACSVPVGVLDRDEMAEILAEIHLTEAVLGQRFTHNDYDTKRAYYDAIFAKHGTTYEAFQQSLDWYARHPKVLTEVYADVVRQLERKRADVEHYVYHPEEDPQMRHVIDSIDLWTRPRGFVAGARAGDSLRFVLDDSLYFAVGDYYQWQFRRRSGQSASAASLNVYVEYNDGSTDSVVYRMADSVATYAYRVRINTRDSLLVKRLYGSFYVSATDSLPRVRIDSVRLWRYYNREKVSLPEGLAARLDSLRGDTVCVAVADSAAHESPTKLLSKPTHNKEILKRTHMQYEKISGK